MIKGSQQSPLRPWCAIIGFALGFLVICPPSAVAQTNTFPTTGNAGIGTTTPGSLLEVNKSQNSGTTVVIDNGHTAASNVAFSGLFFKQAGVNRFFLGSINDGNTTQTGGAGGVQLWNFANGPMLFATNNTERMRIDAAGNVGVGTTAPATNFKLDVAGAQVITYSGDAVSSLLINALGNDGQPAFKVMLPATGLQKAFQLANTGNSVGWASFEYNVGATGKPGLALGSGSIARDTKLFRDSASVLRTNSTMIVDGNVGIGTTAPLYKLDVNGEINATALRVNGTPIATGGSQWITSSSNIYFNTGNVGIGVTNPVTKLHIGGQADNLFQVVSTGSTSGDTVAHFSTAIGSAMIIRGTGNVGLGTTNPQSNLQIGAQTSSSSGNPSRLSLGGSYSNAAGTNFKLRLYDDGVAGNTYGLGVSVASMDFGVAPAAGYNWYSGGTHKMTLGADGNLGIGIASPTSPLFVAGNEPSNDYATLRVKPTVTHGGIVIDSANNTSQAHLRFYKSGVPKWQFRVPFQDGVEDFRLWSWVAGSDVLSITPSGNVGIGLTSPTKKLDVLGDINASGSITGGTINAKYQDVAEWVESSQALTAGTVVVLDHTRSNQVIASSKAYDTRVAGVISLQPGITLGESGAGKVLVATTGRVKIKVDATAGPIQIGDLLVTSDKEGIAKKSDALNLGGVAIHRPGTLIGKALEPLAKGTGEILVLLSLQ